MKAGSIIKVAGLVVVVAALSAPVASAMRVADAGSISTQNTAAAPNDRAGALGIGQTSDSLGMGGQYGANLINAAQASKTRDLQSAKSFTLPLAPDDRPGTATVAPAVVIPYLSHGVGVNATQFNGARLRPDDRAGTRPSVPTTVSTPVATTGDGFNWGSAGIGAAGAAALALLAGFLVVLGRRSRHEGVAVS